MDAVVILPFRGSEPTLQWVLEGYAQQATGGLSVEVRLGGDGVRPPTPPPAAAVSFVTCRLEAQGAAGVRNALLEAAEAEVVIFGNADARPAPDMVRRHVERLRGLPPGSMVLGAAPWERSDRPTVFEAMLAETPAVFFYSQLAGGQWYDYRHAWTLNLSCRLADFRAAGGFERELRPVYYEDITLGHRLMGLRRKGVCFDPDILVTHRHPSTLDNYLDREELLGRMAPVLARVAPAVFADLFGSRTVEQWAGDFAQWVGMDAGQYPWIWRRLGEWVEREDTLLGEGDSRQRLLMTLYQMHIPLKRLAFRLGFLAGMPQTEDRHWQDRKPAGLWRERIRQ